MKRLLCLLLFVLMISQILGSFGVISAEGESGTVELLNTVNLSVSGVDPAGDAFHGNHQTRTVHTQNGDYCAYVTDTYEDRNGKTINVWSIIKVDAEGGSAKVIFTGEQQYDSSQVSLLVDKHENVWAVTINSYGTYGEGLYLSANKVDTRTDSVTSYNASAYSTYHYGSGYGMSFYDAVNERIVCMTAGGDYESGSDEGGSLSWAVFDIKTETWDKNIYSALIPARHCYFYGNFDKNGGLMIMGQRDVLASSLGYAEIGTNVGLTETDYQIMDRIGISRHAANYCWDELDLYYIPNVFDDELFSYSIVEADYSGVSGTSIDRSKFTYRMSNYYPTNQNNNGGDYLWCETADGRTLLHITYNSALIQAAMDRSKATVSTWYHQVWDITDPASAEKIYNSPITIEGEVADEVQRGYAMSFRLFRDLSGDLYLVGSFNSSVSLYAIRETDDGYAYTKVGDTVELKNASNIINISSHRGGSSNSNTLNLLYNSSGKYVFSQIEVNFGGPDPEPVPEYIMGDLSGDGLVSATDLNMIKKYIVGLVAFSDTQLSAADVVADGRINSSDMNLILKYVAGLISEF